MKGRIKVGIIDGIYRRRMAATRSLRRKALAEAKRIARILVKEFGAEEVILYGSLAKGRHFDAISDIDLAVKGLGERYFRSYGYCLRHSDFDLDIRAYEDMPDSWKEKIAEEGKILYAKGQSKKGIYQLD